MGKFVKGDVVVLPFPFSDLSSSKRRPALVVAIASADDVILAQITSSSFSDSYAVELADTDFSSGGLSVASNIRPNKLFTADVSIISYKAGNVKAEKLKDVATIITDLVST
ncbi:MAG: type II toxin-antitoxin system PemK/MazF family toxin [Defluviitaleaceae bacterium]|nr:type II toxin-antitoxin system PemK/MazF family toxin [Defluviitaleaceae bacterium]